MARNPRRIGDVAKAMGVGVETVRFYEREGLVDQPLKPQRGWREYDKLQMRQLGYVRLAREWGLSLGDLKQMQAKAAAPRAEFCSAVRQTVTHRLEEIESAIAELETKRAALTSWLGQCRQRKGDCPLYSQINALKSPKRKRSKER